MPPVRWQLAADRARVRWPVVVAAMHDGTLEVVTVDGDRLVEQAEPLCAVCRVNVDCLALGVGDRTLLGILCGSTTAQRRAIRKAQRAA